MASAMLIAHARLSPRAEKPWLLMAAIGPALYAIAAGAIVPTTPEWRGDFINYTIFTNATGIPIQFIRGLLACLISFGIWAYWGQKLSADINSARHSEFQRKQFYATLAALGVILVAGWLLTEFLGGIYKSNVELQSEDDATLITSRLALETTAVDGMVKALAGTEAIGFFAGPFVPTNAGLAKYILSPDMEATGASDGYILDRAGKVVVATDGADLRVGDDYSNASDFKTAIGGEAGHNFVNDARSDISARCGHCRKQRLSH